MQEGRVSTPISVTSRQRRAPGRPRDAMRLGEERYRTFFENSSEGIWRLEFNPPIDCSLPVDEQVSLAYEHGRFAECTPAMARMCALDSPEMLIGKTLDFMLPSSDAKARAYVAPMIESGCRLSGVESPERDARGELQCFSNSNLGRIAPANVVLIRTAAPCGSRPRRRGEQSPTERCLIRSIHRRVRCRR